MIHYELRCDRAHGFDGWFKDSASFEQQAQSGFVSCPICNSVAVTRALMAPALGRGARLRDESAPSAAGSAAEAPPPAASGAVVPAPARLPVAIADGSLPDGLRAVLQRLRAEVEKSFDYVGTEFAEEARRIHHGEREARGIYGETTPSEAESLAEEGIEFGVLPWLPRSDS